MCGRHPAARVDAMTRRDFVQWTAAGAVACVLGSRQARAGGQARALMLSCMDYRLVDDLVSFMAAHGLQDNYDHVVLAGASIGVVHDAFGGIPGDWTQVFAALAVISMRAISLPVCRGFRAASGGYRPVAARSPRPVG